MSTLIKLDNGLFAMINQGWQSSWLNYLAPWFSDLVPLVPLLALAIWLLVIRYPKRWQVAVGLLILIFFTDFLIGNWLRPMLARPRPFAVMGNVHLWQSGIWTITNKHLLQALSAAGFPSSHASNTMGAAVFLLFFLPRAGLLMAALAVIVGLARVYMGLHYPGDVLAGFAWGAGWGWILGYFADRYGLVIQERLIRWRPSTPLVCCLATGLVFVLAVCLPGVVEEWLKNIEDFRGATLHLLRGEWLIVPGSGRALAVTPLAVLFGAWLAWLPISWGAVIMALLNTALLLWLVIQIRKILAKGFDGSAWLWWLLWATGGVAAACWYGFTALWALAAVVLGLRLMENGRLGLGACLWGLAAAMQVSCLALLAPLLLRGRWLAVMIMLLSAAAGFMLPDLLYSPSAGGWYALDHISHNLIHLPWMNHYVSNLLPGEPSWLSPESPVRLTWLWNNLIHVLWPEPFPLSASTFGQLLAPGLFMGAGLLLAAPMMATREPWHLAAGAALLWGMAFWPGRSPADLPAILFPAMVAAGLASQARFITSSGHLIHNALRVVVAMTMVLSLADIFGSLTGLLMPLLLPRTWYPLSVLVFMFISAAAARGQNPLKYFLVNGSTSPEARPCLRRLWLMVAALLLIVGLESARWEWEYAKFAKSGESLASDLVRYARRNAGAFPASRPIEFFGELRSRSAWSVPPEAVKPGIRSWNSKQNVAYLTEDTSNAVRWALLYYAGPNSRLGSFEAAWSPAARVLSGKSIGVPGSPGRLFILGAGRSRELDNNSQVARPCLFPGLCWQQTIQLGGGPVSQKAFTIKGMAPCRARLSDGVHLGQVREGRCYIPWGGTVLSVADYEYLTGSANVHLKVASRNVDSTTVVQGGMTSKYGFQSLCIVKRDGLTHLGKLHPHGCLIEEDGKEKSYGDYLLVEPYQTKK